MKECNHSGFIAIVGRPNVGKSTLLNRLIGEKVAIVSRKPQTTRTRIMAVYHGAQSQIVFLDTPGFHKPRTELGKYMMGVVNHSIADVDGALLLVEPKLPVDEATSAVIDALREAKLPVVLAINKIDTVQKETLLELIATYSKLYDFAALVPIAAATGEGCDMLVTELEHLLPAGPAFFPEDMLTDQPERQIAAELIREKMLRLLDEEVPHGTAVEITSMKEKKEGQMLAIDATIYCEKESHKGIIIGKQGTMLKKIGSSARAEMERFFGVQVYLQLWVKVKEDWRNNNYLLKEFGFDDQ